MLNNKKWTLDFDSGDLHQRESSENFTPEDSSPLSIFNINSHGSSHQAFLRETYTN